MNTCHRIRTYKITETKSWEQDGGWPDTSQPPDSVTTTPKDLVDYENHCPPNLPEFYCPEEGTMRAGLGNVEHEQTYTTTTSKSWISLEPEIPHVKTYHVQLTKPTIDVLDQVKTWACLDSNVFRQLADILNHHIPS